MFLKKKDASFHGLNTGEGVFGDHLNITEVSHDFHESVLLSLGLGSLGEVLNTVGDLRDEGLDVGNLLGGVAEEVLGVLLNPGRHGLVESVH